MMSRSTDMRSRRGPKGYQRSDDRLREEIIDKLLQQSDIELDEIEVDVSGGKVTLSGTIDNRRVKHQIEDIVDSVWGVKDIANNLRIRSNSENRSGGGGGWGSGGRSGSTGEYMSGRGTSGDESDSTSQSMSSRGQGGQGSSSGKSR
jgi:hypothetical protein